MADAAQYQSKFSPAEGFKRLIEGNQRFASGDLLHPNRDEERRQETVAEQKPFAIILSCSDSRVPSEIIFDQGIGDLFIIRVAGNVVGPIELASIEFAAKALGSNILFIVGHENCGAVSAVLEGNTKDIEPIAILIEPAIKNAKSSVKTAVKDNVKHVVKQVQGAPLIAELIQAKKFAVVGGYYDFISGKVEVLTPTPAK